MTIGTLIPSRPRSPSDASTSTGEIVVRLRGISKTYRRGSASTMVLNAVDLDIAAGQCAMLMGPSGSGKTTLLSIIGCVLQPDEGSAYVLDCNVRNAPAEALAELRRRRVGFVFQRFHLIRGLTALENVGVPLVLDGAPEGVANRRSLELLERVGLADKSRCYAHQLSVGQCQRIAFARALAADPALILADEPTASLDAETGQQAMQLLRRITTEAGKTAIVVTHDSRILPFADRILEMDRGRINELPETSKAPVDASSFTSVGR